VVLIAREWHQCLWPMSTSCRLAGAIQEPPLLTSTHMMQQLGERSNKKRNCWHHRCRRTRPRQVACSTASLVPCQSGHLSGRWSTRQLLWTPICRGALDSCMALTHDPCLPPAQPITFECQLLPPCSTNTATLQHAPHVAHGASSCPAHHVRVSTAGAMQHQHRNMHCLSLMAHDHDMLGGHKLNGGAHAHIIIISSSLHAWPWVRSFLNSSARAHSLCMRADVTLCALRRGTQTDTMLTHSR
jgi:hypothetical protein